MVGLAGAYKLLYNTGACLGWLSILVQVIRLISQEKDLTQIWEEIKLPLQIVQSSAILEVVHSATGLVRSPVVTTALQVASRLYVLWGMLSTFPDKLPQAQYNLFQLGKVQLGLGLVALIIAWALSEITRYSFYAFKELGLNLYASLWLRYTAFIVLYPIGVSCEYFYAIKSIPLYEKTRMYSIHMPNKYNFEFDSYRFHQVLLFIWIPAFLQLYLYMFTQRGKNLGHKQKKA